MEIRLTPEMEAKIMRHVGPGRFRSANDYLAEAVELLEEREQWRSETLDEQRAAMAESIAQADRGEFLTEEELIADLDQMEAEWHAKKSAAETASSSLPRHGRIFGPFWNTSHTTA